MSDFRLPRLWAAFLAWLLEDEWESGVGDFEEYYRDLADERGHTAAARAFRLQVLAVTPGRLGRKLSLSFLMARNYLLLGYRHLKKNRIASGINIFGLSVAVGCSVTVYLFLSGYMNLNRHHPEGDRIFVVEQILERDGETVIRGTSPLAIGPALASDLPQIERMVRTTGRGATVRANDLSFEEWVTFVEDGFLDLFAFPLASGSLNTLDRTDAVILSDQAAKRHFGGRDPVGETLNIVLGFEQTISLTVVGVAEPFPADAGVQFSLLAPFERLTDLAEDEWFDEVRATYLRVREPSDRAAVEAHLASYLDRRNAANPEEPATAFRLENLSNPSPDAWRVERRFADAAHPAFVWMLVAIPLFMIALSCFNYVNISLGAAARRLREIGVRKAVGSSRWQLIMQFLGENVVLCLVALVLGLVISFAFLVPLFNSVFVNQIVFRPSDIVGLMGFLVVLLLLVAVASGMYPALYVSSFATVKILRGRLTVSGRKWLTKGLLTTQFLLAFLTVIVSLYLTLNGHHIVSQEWGYDPSTTIVVRLDAANQYQVMSDAARGISGVETVAGSQGHVGAAWSNLEISVEDSDGTIPIYDVGPDYIEAVGLELLRGRSFDEAFGGDEGSTIVVNEAFARRFLDDELSQVVGVDGGEYGTVGVVKDFQVWFVVQDMPAVFRRSDATDYRFLTVRTSPGFVERVETALEAAWNRAFPEVHFDAFRQAAVFDLRFQSYRNAVQAFSYIAALALLIACMGLFGLASQNAAQRLKEVSIRKVLGASVAHIAYLANRGFAVMLSIAAVIAVVITYIPFRLLVDSLEIEVNLLPLGPGVYVAAYLLVMVTAFVSVGFQARQLTRAAPAEVLRAE